MGYTLAVFGQASLNKNLIFDTFADHFRLGPIDDEGYYTASSADRFEDVHLIIAVDSDEALSALEALNEWSARAGMPYTLVLGSGLRAKSLTEDADRIVAVSDVPERLASLLTEARDAGGEVALALAVEPGNPDEGSRRLFSLLEGAVTTYSIGEGLLPVDPADYLSEEQLATQEFVAGYDPIPQEAAAQARAALEEITGELPGSASGTLIDLLGFLDVIDETVDAAQERCRQVHRLVEDLRKALTAPQQGAQAERIGQQQLAAQAPIEVEQVKPTKVKREWLDPADNTWKPIGRGRPRKNVEIREVSA